MSYVGRLHALFSLQFVFHIQPQVYKAKINGLTRFDIN